jgi:hypothetical protein
MNIIRDARKQPIIRPGSACRIEKETGGGHKRKNRCHHPRPRDMASARHRLVMVLFFKHLELSSAHFF